MEYKNNTENYKLHRDTIVKLLSDSLVEGEHFLFTKIKDGGYGIILSEERLEDISAPRLKEFVRSLNNNPLFTQGKEEETFYTIRAKKE